jgi:hypothetical protein
VGIGAILGIAGKRLIGDVKNQWLPNRLNQSEKKERIRQTRHRDRVCHDWKNSCRFFRINEESGSQSQNWLPEMCGRLLRPTERVLHRLDSQAAILIKEHRWLVVIANYAGSVFSTHYK